MIWKGLGFLTFLLAIAGMAGFFFFEHGSRGAGLSAGAGLAVAAVANWYIGRALNKPLREAKANVFRRHSLYFIAMEWWSVPMLLMAIAALRLAVFPLTVSH
jgi:hypothetical protein